MRFTDENGGRLGLIEAAARGYPAGAGYFSPMGDADLRPAVYAPESAYGDAASSAIAALFPEDVDPLMSGRLAHRAFSQAPALFKLGEGVLVVDYAEGPSASAADYEAAFLAGILASEARRAGARILLADGSGSEGAALAEAIAGLRDLRLALLYPEGALARGIRGQRLAREGGQVSLIAVRGDRTAVDSLIREAAGSRLAGALATAAGPANPARFAARIVAQAATFDILRKGTAGDIFLGIRGGDGLGLAAGLWAWRLGLPITGIVLSVSEKGVLGLEPWGRRIVGSFDADRPGVIRSLALLQGVDREAAASSRAALVEAGGPALDLASSMPLAAAERALEAGLSGHALIVVPRGADPAWDYLNASGVEVAEGASGFRANEAGGAIPGLSDARVDAEIDPSLAELERALTA